LAIKNFSALNISHYCSLSPSLTFVNNFTFLQAGQAAGLDGLAVTASVHSVLECLPARTSVKNHISD